MLAAALWRTSLQQPATECVGRRCVVTQGRIPDEMRGTLFRIDSPDSAPYDHWFDGDGWLCSLAFAELASHPYFVRATSRLTAGRRGRGGRAPAKRSGAGRSAPTAAPANAARLPTNPSNTNLLLRDGNLLALCEGGRRPCSAQLPWPRSDQRTRMASPFFAAHRDGSGGRHAHWLRSIARRDEPRGGSHLVRGRLSPASLLPSSRRLSTSSSGREMRRARAAAGAHTLPFFTFVHDLALTPTRASSCCRRTSSRSRRLHVRHPWAARRRHVLRVEAGVGQRVMVVDRATLELEALVRLPDPAPTCYHIINAFEEAAGDGSGGDVLAPDLRADQRRPRPARGAVQAHAGAAFTAELQCKAVEYRLRLPGMGNAGEAACVGRVELAAAAQPFELPDVPLLRGPPR